MSTILTILIIVCAMMLATAALMSSNKKWALAMNIGSFLLILLPVMYNAARKELKKKTGIKL